MMVNRFWCCLLVLLFPFTQCANTNGDNGSVMVERFKRSTPVPPPLIDGEDVSDSEEPRSNLLHLCSKPGCTCDTADSNQATEANCRCINEAHNIQVNFVSWPIYLHVCDGLAKYQFVTPFSLHI